MAGASLTLPRAGASSTIDAMGEPPVLSKAQARATAYAGLHAAKAARFPFPIEGRIPNFAGAEAAARRLRQLPAYQAARGVKVNPDAPQLPVRAMVLRDGKTLYMPSPRLRGAFLRIRPERVPPGEERLAASLSHCAEYGDELSVRTLAEIIHAADEPPIGLILVGSAAVAPTGARAGKGEGYADTEYALLQELGLPHVPVVTTVHPAQIVPGIAVDAHDLPVDYIITPTETIATETPLPKPSRIAWELLEPEDLQAMPVLQELRELKWEQLSTPDVLAPGLNVLFVGLNPGRKSASVGHNFAGPGNHFWRLLHEAGFTPRRLAPHEEDELLQYGVGITNIVSRASRGEHELTWEELAAGAAGLREKVRRFRPRVVALLGKNVYRAYAGLTQSAAVEWGKQPTSVVEGVIDFVAPNPSARSTVPYETRLHLFRTLRNLLLA
ncbi:MAG TPA: 5-formyltetrahydrofolate cyclo-ligase [Limnochordales bacterium]